MSLSVDSGLSFTPTPPTDWSPPPSYQTETYDLPSQTVEAAPPPRTHSNSQVEALFTTLTDAQLALFEQYGGHFCDIVQNVEPANFFKGVMKHPLSDVQLEAMHAFTVNPIECEVPSNILESSHLTHAFKEQLLCRFEQRGRIETYLNSFVADNIQHQVMNTLFDDVTFTDKLFRLIHRVEAEYGVTVEEGNNFAVSAVIHLHGEWLETLEGYLNAPTAERGVQLVDGIKLPTIFAVLSKVQYV